MLWLVIALTTLNAFSAEPEPPSHPKAVLEANVESGFRLSEKATASIQLKFQAATPGQSQLIPRMALVHYQDQIGIYRLRNGFYKLLPIRIASQNQNKVSIEFADLKTGDQIVTEGVALLRVTDMDAFGGEQ
jgi:hypothetical protein